MHFIFSQINHSISIPFKLTLKPLTSTRQRLFLWLFITLLSLISACSTNTASAYSYSILPPHADSHFMRVNILSSFLFKANTHNTIPVTELSDLAWDKDEQLLYAISDEGYLYHLKLLLNKNIIHSIQINFATVLKDKQKRVLKDEYRDAEGLAILNANNGIKGDTTLVLSFENKPRIATYTPQGHLIKKVKTINKLRKKKYFRHKNKALESVAIHPKYGVLTAAEQPLNENPLIQQTIYSSKGKEWHFNASQTQNSSITALEVLSNGDVLVLERAYNGLLSPVVISLRRLHLENCKASNFCKVSQIASFNSSDGWVLDNFEGLTRISETKYLMVSDNNKNPFQKTIFVFFEILDK